MEWNKNGIRNFFDRALITPLINFLKQGLSPQKLAISVALGLVLGTFPMLGATTLLCTAAALMFRLNMPSIQLINYFAYPLQLALFIPFIRMGEVLFNEQPIPLDLVQIFAMLQDDMLGAIQSLWWTNMHAIVVWCIIAPPVAAIVYYSVHPVFVRLAPQKSE